MLKLRVFTTVMLGGMVFAQGTEFQPHVDYAVGLGPTSVAAGDVNGDGLPDLVSANRGDDSVTVLLSDGNGQFADFGDFTTGSRPWAIALADFNNDGRLDVVTIPAQAGDSGDKVYVSLGNGDGSFAAHSEYAVVPDTQAVATGDVNLDGNQDIVIAHNRGEGLRTSTDTPGVL